MSVRGLPLLDAPTSQYQLLQLTGADVAAQKCHKLTCGLFVAYHIATFKVTQLFSTTHLTAICRI